MQVNKTHFSLFNFLLLNLTQVFPSFVILKTENNIKHADIISKLGNNERARRKQASHSPHALKGQKHLAQGNTLGKDKFPLAPWKGKSFKNK